MKYRIIKRPGFTKSSPVIYMAQRKFFGIWWNINWTTNIEGAEYYIAQHNKRIPYFDPIIVSEIEL